jgi:hypothetical protein
MTGLEAFAIHIFLSSTILQMLYTGSESICALTGFGSSDLAGAKT